MHRGIVLILYHRPLLNFIRSHLIIQHFHRRPTTNFLIFLLYCITEYKVLITTNLSKLPSEKRQAYNELSHYMFQFRCYRCYHNHLQGFGHVPVSYTHLDVYKRQTSVSEFCSSGSRQVESSS